MPSPVNNSAPGHRIANLAAAAVSRYNPFPKPGNVIQLNDTANPLTPTPLHIQIVRKLGQAFNRTA